MASRTNVPVRSVHGGVIQTSVFPFQQDLRSSYSHKNSEARILALESLFRERCFVAVIQLLMTLCTDTQLGDNADEFHFHSDPLSDEGQIRRKQDQWK